MPAKCLVISAFVSMCSLLLAQTPDARIEIEGVQFRPGITLNEALLLFKDKLVSPKGDVRYISAPKTFSSAYSKATTLTVIVGTLYIQNEIVVGACRPWDYASDSGPDDSELARVLFAVLEASTSKESTHNAVVETQVDRTAKDTVESLLIRIGQRTIRMTRQEHYGFNPLSPLVRLAPFVEVEECLYKPGWTTIFKN